MGFSKKWMMERETLREVAIEIHKRAGNVEDSNTYEPCDNGNGDMNEALDIGHDMWRDKDPLVASYSREELMDAIKTVLDTLPSLDMVNDAHYANF